MKYKITFDRIGRHQNIDAVEYEAPEDDSGALAEQVWYRAAELLPTKNFIVTVDVRGGRGTIAGAGSDGARSFGTFTIEAC